MNNKTQAALAALNFAKERGSTRASPQQTQVSSTYLNLKNSQATNDKPTTPSKEPTQHPIRPPASPPPSDTNRVDISIAGTSHRIHCPSHLTDTLKKHSEQINQALRQLRGQFKGKSPSNEELLVLHCLGLYDELAALKEQKQSQSLDNERACALADKLIKTTDELLV